MVQSSSEGEAVHFDSVRYFVNDIGECRVWVSEGVYGGTCAVGNGGYAIMVGLPYAGIEVGAEERAMAIAESFAD